jgi:RHS repeat-associated protein
VWKNRARQSALIDPEQRITFAVTNLIQSTSAVIELTTGELVEVGGFYPNGAREEQLGASDEVGGAALPLEPVGFTGKEADEEVGLTYFGERYLIPRVGRWATPDPLSVHAAGGGEAGNSYHYVSGNLLQSRDPLGLQAAPAAAPPAPATPAGAAPAAGPIVVAAAAAKNWVDQQEAARKQIDAQLAQRDATQQAQRQFEQRAAQTDTNQLYEQQFGNRDQQNPGQERYGGYSVTPPEAPKAVNNGALARPPGYDKKGGVYVDDPDEVPGPRTASGGDGGAKRPADSKGVMRVGPTGKQRDDLGRRREHRVADITGGRVGRDANGQDTEIRTKSGKIARPDVFGPNGELIAVGGPAKMKNLSKEIDRLKTMKAAAAEAGVGAQAWYTDGTSPKVLKAAAKQLGSSNVHTFEDTE